MKKLCLSAAALSLLLASAGALRAEGCCEPCPCPPPKPKPPINFYEIRFKPIVIEKPVYTLVCHEKINHVKCIEEVPVWTEKQKCITVYHKVAREIEKEVVTCHMVPECVCDPCTGCTKVCYKPHTCVKKVKCTVWECVPEQKTITEKVCTVEKREKIVEQKCVVPELIEECEREPVILIILHPIKGDDCLCPPKPACPGCGH